MSEGAFPEGFEWSTATAAHQIEGGNWNSDWWRWEHTPGSGVVEPSGDACDSWHRWEEDADLVAEMGLGAYRFSVEWARIEPEDGEVSVAALDHYRRVCEGLRDRGIAPVVTFHHFTTPRWLADRGGWEDPSTVERFATYAHHVAEHLADVMGRACTINEPNIVASIGWGHGAFPPGVRDWDRARAVQEVFVDAHRAAVESIRAAAPGVPVGLTLSMADYQAVDGAEEKMARRRRAMEDVYLEAVDGDDFVGVQAYTRERIGPGGQLGPEEGVPVLPMGYEYWPQCLEATVRRAWEVTGGRVPLLVTENGIGTDDDAQRIEYLHAALTGLLRTIADGIDVRGYTCWSLLDNFEWAYGYGPRFGLVEVDRRTFERRPKASARWFGSVARSNALAPVPG
ncbi:glycoside hydrolase family 1 protein [Actinomarinicola tropica]|uniref:Family 1 glycosylhydrolase n=1 Tax=Actinomarinicola tropica TaxID=2789776 RepID=A0A5Q2RIT8_9ACTN|nr:family 1 glycosylhydrolase [Actinomarinicola tropica]QGG94491.1 family 1 glycosylhydrolase [Actinomarinicola tropica]